MKEQKNVRTTSGSSDVGSAQHCIGRFREEVVLESMETLICTHGCDFGYACRKIQQTMKNYNV
jgi:hypothetical protein